MTRGAIHFFCALTPGVSVQFGGRLTPVHPGLLAELEGDVRGPVAVLTLARSLDGDLLGQVLRGQGEGALLDETGQDGVQRLGELGGGHRQSLATPPAGHGRRISR